MLTDTTSSFPSNLLPLLLNVVYSLRWKLLGGLFIHHFYSPQNKDIQVHSLDSLEL